MSQQVSSGPGLSFARITERTSCFVIGIPSSRRKAPSGNPGHLRGQRGADRTRRTLSGAKLWSANSSTLPRRICSAGVPMFSPVTARRKPSPSSFKCAHSSAGPSFPPVRKKTGFPSQTAAVGSQSFPCAEHNFQSCQGSFRRADSTCRLEIPGSSTGASPSNWEKSVPAPE